MSGLWAVSTLLCFATNALLGKGAQDWSHPAFKGGERCCARHQSCGKRGKEAGGEETSAEGTCPPPEDTASGFPSNPQHIKAQLLPKESLLKPPGEGNSRRTQPSLQLVEGRLRCRRHHRGSLQLRAQCLGEKLRCFLADVAKCLL